MKVNKWVILTFTMLTMFMVAGGFAISTTSAAFDDCIPDVDGDCSPPDPCFSYAIRNDGNWPNYEIGDFARLTLLDTCEPNEPVYTWRTRDGVQERNGMLLGYTDGNGRFINTVSSLPDIDICGTYTNEQYAIGSVNAPRLNLTSPYTISGCSE